MTWNWQKKEWPNFHWNSENFKEKEEEFLRLSGILSGYAASLSQKDFTLLEVSIIVEESMMTSKIEGELFKRESVKSSLMKNFGLDSTQKSFNPGEQGIADAMASLHQSHANPLSHQMLFKWHKSLMSGRKDLKDIGKYRTHEETMAIVSGPYSRQVIHFQAPPSSIVLNEMDLFMKWWQDTSSEGKSPLSPLLRSAIAHLYFVSIHPFEDGNGRIGRMLALKALFEKLNQPQFILLSQTIEDNRKEYYKQLESSNKEMEIQAYLAYFTDLVIESQKAAIVLIKFLAKKTKFYDAYVNSLNERQLKVVERIFQEGPAGFKGGLSAENYLSITKTSRPTATRDLQDLVVKQIVYKIGNLKSTRYFLNLDQLFPDPRPLES